MLRSLQAVVFPLPVLGMMVLLSIERGMAEPTQENDALSKMGGPGHLTITDALSQVRSMWQEESCASLLLDMVFL
jgi:hypothetical protein